MTPESNSILSSTQTILGILALAVSMTVSVVGLVVARNNRKKTAAVEARASRVEERATEVEDKKTDIDEFKAVTGELRLLMEQYKNDASSNAERYDNLRKDHERLVDVVETVRKDRDDCRQDIAKLHAKTTVLAAKVEVVKNDGMAQAEA